MPDDRDEVRRGRRPTRTEDAGPEYDRRTGRDWQADVALGLASALFVEVMERLTRGVVAEGRRLSKARSTEWPGPLPPWCRAGLAKMRAAVEQRPELTQRAEMALLAHPELEPMVDALATIEEEAACGLAPELSEAEAAVYFGELLPAAEKLRERQARHRRSQSTLQAFHFAVRLTWHAQGRGDPKPSELALLAAATGIEPLEQGLDRARAKWESRVDRWRREMESCAPDWCAQAERLQGLEQLGELLAR